MRKTLHFHRLVGQSCVLPRAEQRPDKNYARRRISASAGCEFRKGFSLSLQAIPGQRQGSEKGRLPWLSRIGAERLSLGRPAARRGYCASTPQVASPALSHGV
jgi:hypothetical protein